MRPAFVIVLSVIVAGCGHHTEPTSSPSPVVPPASNVQVVGRVVDFQSNAGVAGTILEWKIFGVDDKPQTFRSTTNPSGNYYVSLAGAGMYEVSIGAPAGAEKVYVPGGSYTTDLFVGHSDCPIMYGFVFDASTSRPVSAATVTWVGTDAISQTDGSYLLNLGCRSNGYGSGTSGISVKHPAYMSQGIFGTRREFLVLGWLGRRDFALTPR